MQEIFLTETAAFADVVLPATAFPEKTGTFTNTDRRVQLGRQALDAARRGPAGLGDHPGARPPPGPGLELSRTRATSSTRCGRVMPSLGGITWERLEREGAVTYPCDAEDRAGPRRDLRRRLPDARRAAGKLVPAGAHAPRRGARRRVPDDPDDRPAARALAHRRDDPAGERARRARARGRRPALAPRAAPARRSRPGDQRPRHHPPRLDRAGRPRRSRRPRRA